MNRVARGRRVAREPAPEQPPADLEMDTDSSDARASAATIVQVLGLQPQPAGPPYPGTDDAG